jgi:hypothetical protein
MRGIMKTLEKISPEKTASVLLEECAGECRKTLGIYSMFQTKDFSSELIAATLSKLAVSIDDLRTQTDGLRSLLDDKTKWM